MELAKRMHVREMEKKMSSDNVASEIKNLLQTIIGIL